MYNRQWCSMYIIYMRCVYGYELCVIPRKRVFGMGWVRGVCPSRENQSSFPRRSLDPHSSGSRFVCYTHHGFHASPLAASLFLRNSIYTRCVPIQYIYNIKQRVCSVVRTGICFIQYLQSLTLYTMYVYIYYGMYSLVERVVEEYATAVVRASSP